MRKLKVVVFDHEGGWVLTNPAPEEYRDLPHAVNPDLSAVEGLPPEMWALKGSRVVPKTSASPVPRSPLSKIRVILGISLAINLALVVYLVIKH